MKDVEANGRLSHCQRGLGSTSTTRLTPCEVAQHDAPTGAAAALCNVISSRRAENADVLYFSTKSKEWRRIKRFDSRALICRWSEEKSAKGRSKKTQARQMKCDNLTPVKADSKLLSSSRLV